MKFRISLNISKYILAVFFILLATVINLFTIGGKNFLLIGFAFFGAVMLTIVNVRSFPVFRNTSVLLILVYMILAFFISLELSQPLSLVYSAFFVLSYIFYSSFFQYKIDVEQYRRLLLTVFVLYFIGLIAGQIYVYLNLFKPVSGSYGFLQGSFGTILGKDGFRYYSLSSEPSYASFIVIVLYYSYITLDKEQKSIFSRKNLFVFVLLIYMILCFKSAYGVILLGLVLVNHFGFTRSSVALYISIPLILVLISLLGYNFVAINRVVAIVQKIDLTNLHSLREIDFNSYFRLAPFLFFFETSSLTDLSLYLGHGASASRDFIVPQIYGAYQGGEFLGGFLPAFLYDYGIIGMVMVLAFILYLVPEFFSIPTAIMILLLFNANFNTQLFWFTILCLTLNKHYLQSDRKNEIVY
jgi:hypothetical protein